MGTDTSYITTAATHFEGYARALREHAKTLVAADGVRWVSDSAEDFRTLLSPIASHLGTLAGDADEAARSLRAHATAVESSQAVKLLNAGADAGTELVAAVAAPLVQGARYVGDLL